MSVELIPRYFFGAESQGLYYPVFLLFAKYGRQVRRVPHLLLLLHLPLVAKHFLPITRRGDIQQPQALNVRPCQGINKSG